MFHSIVNHICYSIVEIRDHVSMHEICSWIVHADGMIILIARTSRFKKEWSKLNMDSSYVHIQKCNVRSVTLCH